MKLLSWAALGALAGIGLAGCGSNNESAETNGATTTNKATNTSAVTDNGAAGGGGKTLNLAFVTNNASDFWKIARKGTEKAAAELKNVNVDFRTPPGQSSAAAEQQQIVDDLLAKKFDGFAISCVDPKNQTSMINKAAKQSLVITQDSDAAGSDRAMYIGTDNHAAGLQAGRAIKAALPSGGKIMMFVGQTDAQNAHDRKQGIMDALKGSKVELLDVRTDGADHTKAKTNVADTLTKYPDIAGLVGLWSYNGPAILNAVKEADKVGKVKIICFDEEEETLAGVKSGAIEGTVVQNPFEFGHQSIILMSKILNGDKSVIPSSKQKFIPTQVITKANVDKFTTELHQRLGTATTDAPK